MGKHVLHRLSARKVKTAGPGMWPDGGGLYLRVGPDGSGRSWLFRYAIDGRERQHGLGPVHTVTLAEAREKARACRQQRLEGVDPIALKQARKSEQRRDAAKTKTFEDCAKGYLEDNSGAWRSAVHHSQWESSLAKFVYPVIGGMRVSDVDTTLVLKILKPHWQTRTETMRRVRSRIELILSWATVHGFREGENPARWAGHLKEALPAKAKLAPVQHFAAMPYVEVGTFLGELRQREGIPARALEFATLTVARTGEALGTTWDEINLQERVWTVPAVRTKRLREHRVPLSDRAVDIIHEMQGIRHSGLVFPIGPKAMIRLMNEMRPGVTVHGMRAAFRTWVSEQTTVQGEVAEAALGHINGDATEAAYQRGTMFEKRRRLMDSWGAFCSGKGEVVQLKAVS